MAKIGSLELEVKASLAKFESDMKRVSTTTTQTAKTMESAIGGFQKAIIGLGAGFSAIQIIKSADQFNTLQQRIKTATAATGDYTKVSQQLFQISQRTGASLKDSVDVFQSLARSSNELGATNADILKLTQTVQELGTIGGSTGQQMSNALMQFSQAMAGGTVHAEEMNSILENMPELANRIAKGMGMTQGELRKAIASGKILSKDVFESLIKQSGEIHAQFEKIPMSLDKSLQVLQNSAVDFVGQLDQASGFTTTMAKGFQEMALTVPEVASALKQIGDVWERKLANMKIDQRGLLGVGTGGAALQNPDFVRGVMGNIPNMLDVINAAGAKKPLASTGGRSGAGPTKEELKGLASFKDFIADLKEQNKELEAQAKHEKEIGAGVSAEVEQLKNKHRLYELIKNPTDAQLKAVRDITAQHSKLEVQLEAIKKKKEEEKKLEEEKLELLKKQAEEYFEMQEKTQKRIDDAREENDLLQMSLDMTKKQAELERQIAEAKKENPFLSPDQEFEIRENFEEKQAIEVSARSRDYMETLKKQTEELEHQNEIAEISKQYGEYAAEYAKQEYEMRKAINGELTEQDAQYRDLNDTEREFLQMATQRAQLAKEENEARAKAKTIIEGLKSEQDKYNDSLGELAELYHRGLISFDQYAQAAKNMDPHFKQMSETAKDMTKSLSNAFNKAIDDGKKFKDIVKDLGKEMIKIVANRFVFPLVERGLSGLLNRIFPGSGGSANPGKNAFPGYPNVNPSPGQLYDPFAMANNVPGYAFGGPVSPWSPVMVGERGPELFMPRMGGTIVPFGNTTMSDPIQGMIDAWLREGTQPNRFVSSGNPQGLWNIASATNAEWGGVFRQLEQNRIENWMRQEGDIGRNPNNWGAGLLAQQYAGRAMGQFGSAGLGSYFPEGTQREAMLRQAGVQNIEQLAWARYWDQQYGSRYGQGIPFSPMSMGPSGGAWRQGPLGMVDTPWNVYQKPYQGARFPNSSVGSDPMRGIRSWPGNSATPGVQEYEWIPRAGSGGVVPMPSTGYNTRQVPMHQFMTPIPTSFTTPWETQMSKFTGSLMEKALQSVSMDGFIANKFADLYRQALGPNYYTTGGNPAVGMSASLFGMGMGRLRGFAHGGDLAAGRWAVVGEQGPELLMSRNGGRIVSNSDMRRMGGGGNVTINVNANFALEMGGEQGGNAKAGTDISQAIRQVVAQDIHQGGPIAKSIERNYNARRGARVAR